VGGNIKTWKPALCRGNHGSKKSGEKTKRTAEVGLGPPMGGGGHMINDLQGGVGKRKKKKNTERGNKGEENGSTKGGGKKICMHVKLGWEKFQSASRRTKSSRISVLGQERAKEKGDLNKKTVVQNRGGFHVARVKIKGNELLVRKTRKEITIFQWRKKEKGGRAHGKKETTRELWQKKKRKIDKRVERPGRESDGQSGPCGRGPGGYTS